MHRTDTTTLYAVPTQPKGEGWHEKTGKEIKVVIGDLSDPIVMRSLFDGGSICLGHKW